MLQPEGGVGVDIRAGKCCKQRVHIRRIGSVIVKIKTAHAHGVGAQEMRALGPGACMGGFAKQNSAPHSRMASAARAQSCGTSTHRPTQPPHRKAQAHRRTRQGAPPGRPCIHKIRANNMSQPPRTALPAPCTAPKGPRGAFLSVHLWLCAASKFAPICIISP